MTTAPRPVCAATRRVAIAIGLGGFAWLAGCTNVTGLGASSTFKCAAPLGMPCQSLSAVAAGLRTAGGAAAAAQAPSPAVAEPPASSAPRPPHAAAAPAVPPRVPASLLPTGALRSDPIVVRMWIAPWEDQDGDLNDQGHVYLQLDSGRWLLEHNRERIRRAYAPQAAASIAARGTPQPLPAATGASAARAQPAADAAAPRLRPPSPTAAGAPTLQGTGGAR